MATSTSYLARPAPSLSAERNAAFVTAAFVAFTIVVNFAFPKAGIKIEGLPLTFGYILSGPLIVLAIIRARALLVPLDRCLILIACSSILVWSLFAIHTNGIEADASGLTMAYILSLSYLPIFGMVVFSSLLLDEHHASIESTLLWSLRLALFYGVFLFFYKELTGRWIEIPYITVNADDVGQLDDKFINRGGIFKLISTYNNGNIFGVCMAIIGPWYLRLERSKLSKAVYGIAVLLTLSRTAWIGLTLILLMNVLSRRLRLSTLLLALVALLVVGAGVYVGLSLMGRDASFLMDSNLGNRFYEVEQIMNGTLLPTNPIEPISEIVYAGVIYNYGFLGLALFVIALLMPAALLWLHGVSLFGLSRASACLQGLVAYAILAGSDGTLSYIPTMMFFWMIAGLGLWYARNERLALSYMPAPRARPLESRES